MSQATKARRFTTDQYRGSYSLNKDTSGDHIKGNHISEPPVLHKELCKIAQSQERPTYFHYLVDERKSEIDLKDAAGKTVLQIALELNLMMEASTLVLAGADVTLSYLDEQKILYSVCLQGQTQVVELLLGRITNIDVWLIESETESPLAAACRKGYLDIVNLLLENGADANFRDDDWWTPLHWACLCNEERIIERLLQVQGLNIDITEEKEGWTPLNLAVHKGRANIVSQLLKKDANLHTTDSTNWSPLMTATKMEDLEIVKMILGHKIAWGGVYLELPDEFQNTPLHVASMQGSCGIASELISAGADVDALTDHLRTPLHFASLAGNELVVKLLLERKANVNATDEEGFTPLHLASGFGQWRRKRTPELDLLKPDVNSLDDSESDIWCWDPPPTGTCTCH